MSFMLLYTFRLAHPNGKLISYKMPDSYLRGAVAICNNCPSLFVID